MATTISRVKRKPLQGVMTIIRFNWHLHLIAITGIAILTILSFWLPPLVAGLLPAMASAGVVVVAVSLLATYHAYDASGLYQLEWLKPWIQDAGTAANIHAGFDETSVLLKKLYPHIAWHILDFYDPAKHTEVSIKRARKAHPPAPGTLTVQTDRFPLESHNLDCVLLVLAAHEIRDLAERIAFFREIDRVLDDRGHVIVTEHLRDWQNTVAYTVGAWHFHSRSEWLATFEEAGFVIVSEIRNNLLITTFVLVKHASAP